MNMTMTPTDSVMDTDNSANPWLAQADLVLLLADLFRSPREGGSRLKDVTPQDLRDLLQAASLDRAVGQALGAAVEQARQMDAKQWELEHCRLFEGASVCPLNQTAFVRRDKGAVIGDLAGFFRAFGWQPSGSGGEKADHLVTELEFLAVMLVMAAGAKIAGLSDHQQTVQKAMASLASDHLGDWFPALAQHLRACAHLPLHAHAAQALETLWTALVQQHSWTVSTEPAAGPMPQDPSDTPYECGAAPQAPIELGIDAPRRPAAPQ